MPHRHADWVNFCTTCDAEATSTCSRCERPVCDDHAPSDEERCPSCEQEWARRVRGLPVPVDEPVDDIAPYVRWAVVPTVGIMLVGAIVIGIMAGNAAMGVILGLLIGAVLSVPLFGLVSAALLGVKVKRSLDPIRARIRLRAERRQFLGERAVRRALPAPGFGEPTTEAAGDEAPDEPSE